MVDRRKLKARERPKLAPRHPAGRLPARHGDSVPRHSPPEARTARVAHVPARGLIPARPGAHRTAQARITGRRKGRVLPHRHQVDLRRHGPHAGEAVAHAAGGLSLEQEQNIITCLTACKQEHADDLATMAMMCLGFGENSWHTYGCNSGGYCGVFQLGAGWQRMHPYWDVGYWAVYALRYGFYSHGGLIHLSHVYPHQTPGYLTNLCQGAYANFDQGARYYDLYEAQARWAISTYAKRAGYKVQGQLPGQPPVRGSIPGAGQTPRNVYGTFRSTDWAGNVENCWKLVLGGANEASHMAGLTRQRIGKLQVIGWRRH